MVSTYGQGDLLPEQAGEDVNEEEQDHEENAFREGHKDVEEEKDDGSTAEGEGFDEPENNTV